MYYNKKVGGSRPNYLFGTDDSLMFILVGSIVVKFFNCRTIVLQVQPEKYCTCFYSRII